jgi:hypothetical protein
MDAKVRLASELRFFREIDEYGSVPALELVSIECAWPATWGSHEERKLRLCPQFLSKYGSEVTLKSLVSNAYGRTVTDCVHWFISVRFIFVLLPPPRTINSGSA